MKIAIAALLLALGADVAMAQTSTSPPTSRAPGATETPATGPATGTSPPRVQGNVPPATPGGAGAPQTSRRMQGGTRTPPSPDKQPPAPPLRFGGGMTIPARYSFTYVKDGESWLIADHHSSAVHHATIARLAG